MLSCSRCGLPGWLRRSDGGGFHSLGGGKRQNVLQQVTEDFAEAVDDLALEIMSVGCFAEMV